MDKSLLNERSQQILKALIIRYIREGQPIGSKTIAEDVSMGLSPATIRNIFAELEEAGYLKSPHTSAGRIPTTLGYRFFVNKLLQVKKNLDFKDDHGNPLYLNTSAGEQELIESASALISNFTKLTGIVTAPRHEQMIFRHIEFLPLSHHRVLVILVVNEQEVQNLIIQTAKIYSEAELQQAANFLIMNYAGKNLLEMRQTLIDEMRNDHLNMNEIIHAVFEGAEKTVKKQKEEYVIAGESNLLNLAEENGVDQLKVIFNAFGHKQDILHLLDQCIQTEGIQIYIGHESGHEIFGRCSLITSTYAVEDRVLGVLGVIGPTRMDYERVISAVDITAKLLGSVLKDRLLTES